ncbi:cytochrome c biogenesis CcdA family protein [Sorangium sp. So ce861]|uniref:cytochrome c biogenesis CcdA family protein n=1 Tax=Sorangium sp. So ce861 TaxID=3133323 RepID=UPI003F5E600D
MDLAGALSSGSLLALPIAFVGGLVVGLNPCCLALFPAAAATCCAGACDGEKPRTSGSNALAFVLGTATATTILGVIAAVAGRTLEGFGGWVRYAVALVPVVMGIHLLGWVRLPMPRAVSGFRGRGVHGAYASGLLLSLVIGPCGTPALAAILSYAAFRGSVPFAALLLFLYGLGSSIPLMLAGTASGRFTAWMSKLGWGSWMERSAGVILVAVGVGLLWTAR